MSEYTDRFVPDGQYVISINDKPIVPPAADATFPARVEVGTAKDAAVLHIMGPEAQIQLTHNGQTLSLGRGQDDSEVDPKPLQWIMGEARSNSVWETPEEDLLIAFGGMFAITSWSIFLPCGLLTVTQAFLVKRGPSQLS